MLFEIRGLAQNLVLSVGPLRRAIHRHLGSTGMNGNDGAVQVRLQSYLREVEVSGASILELGPGHTPEVLVRARQLGATRCVGLDTDLIVDPLSPAHRGIELLRYDGRHMPLGDGTFDVVWSSDVLEHVHDAAAVVRESFRVLKAGGAFVAFVDLRDHYHLDDEKKWLTCLKYPEDLWFAMTSNRSFVNRLRASDWLGLLEDSGFVVTRFHRVESEVLRKLHRDGAVKSKRAYLSSSDATTYRIEFTATKPGASAKAIG